MTSAPNDRASLAVNPSFRTEAGTLVVQMSARGIDPSWLTRPLRESGFAPGGASALRVEAADDWRWGSVEAAFLARVVHQLSTGVKEPELVGVPSELRKLLALAAGRQTPANRAEPASSWISGLGSRVRQNVRALGTFVALLGEVVRLVPRFVIARAKVRGAEVFEVLAESSSRALMIVAIVNLLTGAILAFVGAVQLRRFGAGIYVADLVGIASVRELTPIVTAIVLAGRTGASFAARIATMQGNEEIDALTTLGVSPIEFLVVPRVIALTLLMPLLYVYGCTFAILGGMWVSAPILDLSSAAYLVELREALAGANFAIGGLKAAVFGALVALLGCHYGLQADRSAAGVGYATTNAVVASIVGIIAIDAVFAVCANALGV
jgi:phospholipid/cholesterol/gamma-HCH transport system permease protein